jgi:hypothetical protein
VAGLVTFKRGYVWRVGDGEKINIWNDHWIPSSPNKRVTTLRGATAYTKVLDLISPITGRWDEHLLYEIFNSLDVERIVQIPLNYRGFEDFVVRGLTNHGRYKR